MGSQVSDMCIDCLGKEDEFNDTRSKHIKQIYFDDKSFEEHQIDVKLPQNELINVGHIIDNQSLKPMESAQINQKINSDSYVILTSNPVQLSI